METVLANHQIARSLLDEDSCRLRPHFKAHKCLELLRIQTAETWAGVTCQTVGEAAVLSAAGFSDILISNEIVDPTSIEQLVEVARHSQVSVAVDNRTHVARLEEAMRKAGGNLDVLVEIDVGHGRCGVAPESVEVVKLAKLIDEAYHLRFRGLQAYEGQCASEPVLRSRKDLAIRAGEKVRDAISQLSAEGFRVTTIAGGSTATLPFIGAMGIWNEVEAGTYVLMDGFYSNFDDLPFRPALFAVGTAIHRSAERAVLDIGLKQISTDRGLPTSLDGRIRVTKMADEHSVLEGSYLPQIGDRVVLLPQHLDPTVHLHSKVWLVDQSGVREAPIDPRA